MMTMKLSNHKSAQCKIQMSDNGEIHFISYTTTVIIATPTDDDGNYNLVCTGTYSQTTRKQISWFLREYFPALNYEDMKESAECGNVFTAHLNKDIC